MISFDQRRVITERVMKSVIEVSEKGQKEYAHDTNNALANFERLGKELNLTREKVLWVYFKKHLDGILAHINGHTSQRESVDGRIMDAITYLILLQCMVDDKAPPRGIERLELEEALKHSQQQLGGLTKQLGYEMGKAILMEYTEKRKLAWKNTRGEKNKQAKLTNEMVRAIRRAFSTGKFSKRYLAREYKVSESTIFRAITKESYKDSKISHDTPTWDGE